MAGIRRYTFFLFFLRFLRVGLSLFSVSLSSKFFGISFDRDAWLLAFAFVSIMDVMLWGALNETFRTKFIFLREEKGDVFVLRSVTSLIFFTLLISGGVCLFVMLKPNLVVNILAPSYEPSQTSLLAFMLVILAPSFLLNQFTHILNSILNAYESYFVPEISGFISSFINIIVLFLLAPIMGIYSLAISFYLGLFVLLILLFIELRKRKISLVSNICLDYRLALPFLLFALPFYVPYISGQVSSLIEKSLAASLEVGSISLLDYSRKFSDIYSAVLGSVLTTILLPILSLKYIKFEESQFVKEFRNVFKLSTLIIVPISVVLFTSPQLFIRILYKSANFNQETIYNMSILIRLYTIAAWATFMNLNSSVVLMSSNRGKFCVIFGILSQIIAVTINFVLFQKVEVFIFPISLFCGQIIAAIGMFYYFPFERKTTYILLMRSAFVLIISGYLSLFLFELYSDYIRNDYLLLSISGFVTIIVVAMTMFILRFESPSYFYKTILKYLNLKR